MAILLFIYFISLLEIKPRAACVLGKHSIIDPIILSGTNLAAIIIPSFSVSYYIDSCPKVVTRKLNA